MSPQSVYRTQAREIRRTEQKLAAAFRTAGFWDAVFSGDQADQNDTPPRLRHWVEGQGFQPVDA
ncbi:hypothetical protein [Aliiroseovarius marinus]|uniref:hypothetical protein n=1 Tax=Aliiroseovarius marinus TaxID=2500159 RepID=UPI003D7DC429